MRPLPLHRISLAAVLVLFTGCGTDLPFLLQAGLGQASLLLRSVPVAEAIEGGNLTPEQIAKLQLVLDARRFAGDELALTVTRDFNSFYDSGGAAVAFNVSASRQDAFAPRLWTFPIVGTVPYLGFFSRTAAEAEVDELLDEGYDVVMYEVDAYSGIGILPNLILSPMLERSDESIVDTVIHELLHSNIWKSGDTTFNESLATFYGRQGALDFYAARYPDRPELLQALVESYEDTDRVNAFLFELYQELDAFYSSDLSPEEKIAGREGVYQAGRERSVTELLPLLNHPADYEWLSDLPANNAWMLGFRRYNLDLEIFEQVHEVGDGDWSASRRVFQQAAEQADSFGYLRQWLAEQDGGTG